MTHDDAISLLRELVSHDATELHIKVPARPLLRIGGLLVPTQHPAMTPQSSHQLATALLGLARKEIPLATLTHTGFSFGVAGVGRFHASIYRQRGSLGMHVHRIPHAIPDFDTLGVPVAAESALQTPGLTLLCGDERRRALMASLVDRFNQRHRGMAMVIEDPLTYLHRDATALIAQRGVGTDVASFAAGVEEARRQRVDLLCVGDVPDRQTTEAVLLAAEAGLTVHACVAAPDPNLAASWLLRHYASDRDSDIKQRIKRLLRGVICMSGDGPARIVSRRAGMKKAS